MRNYLNVKLRCTVLLSFGLKGVKIFWNVSKVCMHACSSNGHPNLWSNLNSKKLFEKETPSFGFDRVGLKGVQNSSKRHEFFVCMLVYPICIQTYDQVSILRIWSKLRLHRAVLLGFGLKMPKIALNIVKVGMHSYFPNAVLNLWLNFISKKLVQSETPSCMFLCVPLKWVSKSTFKFDF